MRHRTACHGLLAILALILPSSGGALTNLLAAGVGEFSEGYRTWDRASFNRAASLFGRACAQDPRSCEAHYWKGTALFHAVLHSLGDGSAEREVKPSMDEALDALERAVELRPDDSESHALISTLTGMRIAARPATAIWLGPRVLRHKRMALAGNPGNPRAYYLIGTSCFHAPGILGGREKGLEYFLRAEELFERERQKVRRPLEPAWGYGSCLTFIGRTYLHLNRRDDAEAYFRKALAVNPMDHMAQEGLRQCRSAETEK